MSAINFAKIHKLVLERYCLQKSITHRHTGTNEYIISRRLAADNEHLSRWTENCSWGSLSYSCWRQKCDGRDITRARMTACGYWWLDSSTVNTTLVSQLCDMRPQLTMSLVLGKSDIYLLSSIACCNAAVYTAAEQRAATCNVTRCTFVTRLSPFFPIIAVTFYCC